MNQHLRMAEMLRITAEVDDIIFIYQLNVPPLNTVSVSNWMQRLGRGINKLERDTATTLRNLYYEYKALANEG